MTPPQLQEEGVRISPEGNKQLEVVELWEKKPWFYLSWSHELLKRLDITGRSQNAYEEWCQTSATREKTAPQERDSPSTEGRHRRVRVPKSRAGLTQDGR